MGLFGFGRKTTKAQASPCHYQQGCTSTSSTAETDQADILILGSGCKNCHALEDNTRAALKQMGNTDRVIGHITDFQEIAKYGVMSTPALVVDGAVVSAGTVLKPEEIVQLLKKVRT